MRIAIVIVGIKVWVGRNASGTSGIVPLEVALEVANEVGLPLMAHIDHPPPSYEEVLARLRPSDILTHAFRPFPNAPVGPQGKVKQEVLEPQALLEAQHDLALEALRTFGERHAGSPEAIVRAPWRHKRCLLALR